MAAFGTEASPFSIGIFAYDAVTFDSRYTNIFSVTGKRFFRATWEVTRA